MRTGEGTMKILKIENNQGYFSIDGSEYELIDKINKEALLALVNIALDTEVEIDEYDDELIKNQAHQILYKNISEKIAKLNQERDDFKDDTERLFLPEYEKYKQPSP